MAPILIDTRGLFKFGFLAVVVTASTFAGGFFTGYQKASDFYQIDVQQKPLTLPEQKAISIRDIELQAPDIIAAGEQIDVDQADMNQANTDQAEINQSSTSAIMGSQLAQNTAGEAPPVQLSEMPIPQENLANKASPVKPIIGDEKQLSNFDQSNINKAKFTVQAGTYGKLSNAENMMKSLQDNGLDAYVTDYTNKKNKTRYNVRFGYFSDRKTALKLLKQYKTSQQGDGYLVKFSAINIVNVAEVKAPSAEALENESQPQKPSILLPDSSTESISLLGISNR